MEKQFEYNFVMTPEGLVDIENIFQTFLEARDNKDYLWYLYINTENGVSEIYEFGPILEKDMLINGFSTKYTAVECKDKVVTGIIKKFLGYKNITKSNIIEVNVLDINDLEYMKEQIPDIINYFLNKLVQKVIITGEE